MLLLCLVFGQREPGFPRPAEPCTHQPGYQAQSRQPTEGGQNLVRKRGLTAACSIECSDSKLLDLSGPGGIMLLASSTRQAGTGLRPPAGSSLNRCIEGS